MNKITIFLSTLLIVFAFNYSANAQFTDDMESYTAGSTIFEGNWTDWAGSGTTAIYSSSVHANSGTLSGYVPANGTTDGILNLGNKTEGDWGLKFMMYIPSGKEGYFNIQGVVPPGSSPVYAVGDIYFNKNNSNPGHGYVSYNSSDGSNWSNFTFPHDQWFEVIINIHFDYTNTWQFIVNGNIAADWHTYSRWVAAGQEEETTSLGGIDFFSYSTNCEYWIDDFDFINGHHTSTVSINDVVNSKIKLYPNPTTGIINFEFAQNNINKITVSDITGKQVIEKTAFNKNAMIDLSSIANGIYIIKIQSDNKIFTTKIKKE